MIEVSHREDKVVITVRDDKGLTTVRFLTMDEAIDLAQEILDTCGHIDPDA